MPGERSDGGGKEAEAVAGFGEATVVLAVHNDLVGRIEIEAIVEDAAAPEGGAGGDVAAASVEDEL